MAFLTPAVGTRSGAAARSFGALMAHYDLSLNLTTAASTVTADFDPGSQAFQIAGHLAEPIQGCITFLPFNKFNMHPDLPIPVAQSKNPNADRLPDCRKLIR